MCVRVCVCFLRLHAVSNFFPLWLHFSPVDDVRVLLQSEGELGFLKKLKITHSSAAGENSSVYVCVCVCVYVCVCVCVCTPAFE